jgi:hypothetical protein
MTVRRLLIGSLAVLVGSLACATHAEAHRLDEYLQAARVSIDIDRVTVEIDLTAGTRVATYVIGWIDTDRDGQLSAQERTTYAQQVIESVTLAVDGAPTRLALIESEFPDVKEIADGVGTIRLRAVAAVPAAGSGGHVLTFVNSHHSESSVYLANALVPANDRITIANQRRDPGQHLLTLEYAVAFGIWPQVGLFAVVIALLGLRTSYRFLPERAGRRELARASAPSSRA